jgi:chemotaxis protein methyltransferase CheR
MNTVHDNEVKEIDDLLAAVFEQYGYDFRNYSRASIERRIRHFLPGSGCGSVPEMTARLLEDRSFFSRLVRDFSITVTDMFRDPFVYACLREQVVPVLKTFPFIRIWHAGCATGEEAYSLAVVLKEEGLYDRSTVFVTDFNDDALRIAKQGIYPLEKVRDVSKRYQEAGGTGSFSDYYHADGYSVALDSALRKNMVFANYNLVTDGVFGEFHLILCRNVLIYFNRTLQDRVFGLFRDSLVHGGFLCLGTKETPGFSSSADEYTPLDARAKVYRKCT